MSLELADLPDATQAEAVLELHALIYDRLVRLGPQGQPLPALALSWEHDAQATKWRFKLRSGVKWQDGTPLAAEEVAAALAGQGLGASVHLEGAELEVDLNSPTPGLLATLATGAGLTISHPAALTAAPPPGSPAALPIGTGPFRLALWEPGRRALLQANDDYWDGRPFVDFIEIQMGRASRDALLDLELGKADLVELGPLESRRAQQEGKEIWTSAPLELLSLRFLPNRPAAQDRRVRLALAESIDRAAIQKVLWQNYGEVTGSIFPASLSGYSFLFPAAMNLEEARRLRDALGAAPTLKMGYDARDTLARLTAERVAVNAHDAGLTLELVPLPEGWREKSGEAADLLVERARLGGPTLAQAVGEAARTLGFPENGIDPERIYLAEREFLDSFTVVPLIHVPELLGIGPRVKDWSATPWGAWRLEQVCLEGR